MKESSIMTGHDGTVLFVDDEPALLASVENTLRKEPYDVVTATSASAGLSVLRQRPVDVVVSDERMPAVRGSEFLAYVREHFPATIRIMLTGQASLDAVLQVINEGEVYRVLTKPCSPLLLTQTLRDALIVRQLKREGARLLAALRQQGQLLASLERQHPGITAIAREGSGAILLEDMEPARLLEEMRLENDRIAGGHAADR